MSRALQHIRQSCILIVYMATTTIRVSTDTRDLLKALSARRKRSAGDIVSELVHSADDDLLLADAEADFAQVASDPSTLAAYRAETHEIGGTFDAIAPDW
jgi:hypothetical protein